MIRSRVLVLICFLVGLTLNASAQQSTPASPAPPPLVGTLAGHPDWPAAKNPGDVDTVDHLIASLYDVVSGPAGQRDWDRFRSLFVPDGRIVSIVPESVATKNAPARKGDAVFLTPDMFAQQNDPTSRRTVSSSAASPTELRSLAILSRCGARPKSGMRRTTPAILARHRFVPDCACSRTLLDRQPSL